MYRLPAIDSSDSPSCSFGRSTPLIMRMPIVDGAIGAPANGRQPMARWSVIRSPLTPPGPGGGIPDRPVMIPKSLVTIPERSVMMGRNTQQSLAVVCLGPRRQVQAQLLKITWTCPGRLGGRGPGSHASFAKQEHFHRDGSVGCDSGRAGGSTASNRAH